MRLASSPVQPRSHHNTDGRPSWSPDGSKVAVELDTGAVVVSRDNQVLHHLGPEDKWVATPTFSPDGSQLAYSVFTTPEGKPSASWGIYVCEPDGSNATALTHSGRKPEYSPDGDHIAFLGYHHPRYSRVAVMESNGFQEHPISETGGFHLDYCWDPRGQQVVYEALTENGPQLRISDLSGAKDRILSDGDGGRYRDRNPEWSAATDKLIIEREVRGFPVTELWTLDPETGQDKQVLSNGRRNVDPTWSPDGSRLAFASSTAEGDYDIYVCDADGKNLKVIADTPADEHAPSWSPDGKSLAFLERDRERPSGQKTQLRLVDV